MGLQQRSEFFRVKNLEIWPKTRILSKDLLRFWSFFRMDNTWGYTTGFRWDDLWDPTPSHHDVMAHPTADWLDICRDPPGRRRAHHFDTSSETTTIWKALWTQWRINGNGPKKWHIFGIAVNWSKYVKMLQNVALTGRLTMFFLFWPCLRAGTLTGTQKWPSRRKLIFYDILPLHFWSQYSTWN